MSNDRLRSSLRTNNYRLADFAEELGVAAKTVERWITKGRTPHRTTAYQVAKLLNVPAEWLWPTLETANATESGEVQAFYPHRSAIPKGLWLNLLVSTQDELIIFADASLFLVEENPEAIQLIRHKAQNGTTVRILLGNPDSAAMDLRGREERLYDAIPARIRMALAYYKPLASVDGVQFRLHETALYNSIFRFDNQMLINQHIYGTYGYLAPVLHLQQTEGADLFATYMQSFELIWQEESKPFVCD